MAYLLTHFWPEGTEAQYRATAAAVHREGRLPEGQLSHFAGPTAGGYLVAAIWESKAQNDRFIHEVLMPSLPVAGGFAGQPVERGADIAHNEMS